MQQEQQNIFTLCADAPELINKHINEIPYDCEILNIETLTIPYDFKFDNLPCLIQKIHIENIHVLKQNNRMQIIAFKEDIENLIEKVFIKIPFGCVITYDTNNYKSEDD
jgi:hypothetical protein